MKHLFHICLFVIFTVSVPTFSAGDHSHRSNLASQAFQEGNFSKALELWLKEAELGDMTAQAMVAAMYASGKGTALDYQQAVHWYRLAAMQGFVNAQYSLGKLYLLGQGVAKSSEWAWAWWQIAADNGNEIAQRDVAVLQSEMTPLQIEKAQQIAKKLSKELLP